MVVVGGGDKGLFGSSRCKWWLCGGFVGGSEWPLDLRESFLVWWPNKELLSIWVLGVVV